MGARSREDGAFDMAFPAGDCRLEVVEPGWTTVQPAAIASDAPADDARIIAARAKSLSGIVVARDGRALPGARVELRFDAATWAAFAGMEGRFELEAAPALPDLTLRTSLPGWRADERRLALPFDEPLRIALDREDPGAPEIEGTVLRADRSPAASALVSFGASRARTDATGSFRLLCGWFDAGTPLVATAPGEQPAVLEGYGADVERSRGIGAGSLPSATLVLPGPALAIRGRVLTPGGEPCKGWRVLLLDPTRLDPGGSSRDVAETVEGGEVRTDASGAFRIEGLRARPYGLLAVGRGPRGGSELIARADAVQAGTEGLVLTTPDSAPGEAIRGRVVDTAGAAVALARVALGRAAAPGSPGEFGRAGGAGSVSGADGRFEILDAPASMVFLVVTGEGILPARIELAPSAPRGDVELRVRRRRELTFDGSRASPHPDGLRALDAAGRPTPLFGSGLSAHIPFWTAPLAEGRSGPIGAAEDARWILVYRGGAEVARLSISPSPGPVDLTWP